MSVPGLILVWENLQGRNSVFIRNSWGKEIQKIKKHKRCIYFFFFWKIEKAIKKIQFQNKLKKHKNNVKSIWKIIKSIIGKFRVQNDSFPKSLIIANEDITDKKSVAEKFNSFFVDTGTNLAAKIPHGTTNFESYPPNNTTIFQENCLTKEEFKNTIFC